MKKIRKPKVKTLPELRRAAFLTTLRATGSYAAAARAGGFTISSLRAMEERDDKFAEDVEMAQAEFVARLEKVALKRATGQTKRAILFKGKQVRIKNPKTGKMEDYWESEHADNVLMFLMKAHARDLYGQADRVEGTITVKEVKGVSPDDL